MAEVKTYDGYRFDETTQHYVAEEDLGKPHALQYDIPPVREVPVYDPFDPVSRFESTAESNALNAVNPARRDEEFISSVMANHIIEGFPLQLRLAKEDREFENKVGELIHYGYLEDALQLFDAKLEKEAPYLKKIEDKLAANLAEVDPTRIAPLMRSVRISNIKPENPQTAAELDLMSVIAAGGSQIPSDVKALVLNRAMLQEAIANERASAGKFRAEDGRILYDSPEASDMYYASAIAFILVGPLPDAEKYSASGYPKDYLNELQNKSVEKVEELLTKARNFRSGLNINGTISNSTVENDPTGMTRILKNRR